MNPEPCPETPVEEPPTREDVENALQTVIDPEIGLNLLDLGMIYDIRFEERIVHVSLTLTNPGCPLQEVLVEGVRTAVQTLRGVKECVVHLVWDPPWNPSMISEKGRAFLA